MKIKRVAILGVGLLGGSIGLAVRSKITGCTVVGYGHRRETLAKAIEIGAIEQFCTTPADTARGADLVILCTPVGLLGQMIQAIAPALGPETVVTDVGSTKRSVVQAGQVLSRFIGSHPMAGSEKRGVEFARADLFEQALCITTPTAQTDPAALEAVEQFWKTLGMHITRLAPNDHDRLLAEVSHLPHALTAALVAMQDEAALPLAGKGFLDATRIASGDGALWRDILQDNRDAVKESLVKLRAELDQFESLLDPVRADELTEWLNQAAQRRGTMLPGKLRDSDV